MTEATRIADAAERERALDPRLSCIVQAPAGSGKTGLLIQRFLALLAGVKQPEEIAAITFTIKAAAEMRHRVFEALRAARHEPRPPGGHLARTWDLARAALARNDERGWRLEESPERVRVQTIDALCASLTRQMPVMSRFGGQPEVIEDARTLYAEAARNLFASIEDEEADPAVVADVAALLAHLDNDSAEAVRLLAALLGQRDHWIRALAEDHTQPGMEAALASARLAVVARARTRWPAALPAPQAADVDGWIAQADQWLTTAGKWRAGTPRLLTDDDRLRSALRDLQRLPPARYTPAQWSALEAILKLLPRALLQLQVVFASHGQADFAEIAQGASRALETDEGPTDLLLALDYRIRHILVDEFQDTSFAQWDLLRKLTSGWEPDDGRTLFLVGDPMQSIYRFREAEVGLFLRAWHKGIGDVRLEPLTLSANFRSQAGIVDWVNATFSQIMPAQEEIATGAVPYAPSVPVHPAAADPVTVHAFAQGDAAAEARRVVEVVSKAQGRVAILVRSRPHLYEILPRLRDARLAYRAIEIEPLEHRPVVQDLLALAHAISHPGDRPAWLALLRAPWCGLTLADLLAIVTATDGITIWEGVVDDDRLAKLSPDGRERAGRLRSILAPFVANRRRTSLRAAVEGAWLALGGPACVESPTDLEDADIFLDHLEKAESAGDLDDFPAFEESLAALFALPDLEAPETLQVMTIHKAKGLEFDTVIVPGLARTNRSDESRLFMWMDTTDGLVLAPMAGAEEGDKKSIYEFIKRLDVQKGEHESVRLLYVAATRAKRALHLMGSLRRDAAGDVAAPSRGSLLEKLWPVVAPAMTAQLPEASAARPSAAFAPVVPPAQQGQLRRLQLAKFRYDTPAAVAWSAPIEARTRDAVEYEWVGETARHVGSVVHRWMQRMALDQLRGWDAARIAASKDAIRAQLAAHGVSEEEIPAALARVSAALEGALGDPRGRWILGAQREAANEHRLTALVDGVPRSIIIDRLFADDEGKRWIVDYKTSAHEGSGLEAFLDSERERYRPQLTAYAAALGGDPSLALYFPLVKGWREVSGTPPAPSPPEVPRGKTLPLF
jgi:ATP-dependent exoDNAse (exonuclease V) beta subunit